MWWFGYTVTIMLVTTLSTIRAWSIASPFKYKMHSSRLVTAVLSTICWMFGVMWLAVRYILQCELVLAVLLYLVPIINYAIFGEFHFISCMEPFHDVQK